MQISFVLNGTKQEVAFQIPKESLGEKALFPHVLSKNIKFEVNFGERSEPWIADEAFKEGFEWASKIPEESRVRGPKKPEEKKDCEVSISTVFHFVPFVDFFSNTRSSNADGANLRSAM